MIEDVDYTASGYIQAIAPDGTVISRHRQEREAQQACFQHAKDNEDLLGDGVHDYILRSPDVRMSIRLLSVGGNPTNEDTTPPDPPAGVFNNSVTSSGFTTNWTNGPESDLQEHNVYRSSTGPSSGFSLVDTVTVPTASYSHTGLTAETQYWVYVTALDSSGNESAASSVVSSTTNAASADLYDLSGFSIPFSYNWPTAPSTVGQTTENVTTIAQFQAAVQQSNVLINVAAGTYNGDLIFTGDDIDIVMSNSATLNGTFDMQSTNNRIRWTGGTIVSGTAAEIRAANDILFNNVNFQLEVDFKTGGNRHAIINSTLTSGSLWGIFWQQDGDYNDVILANVRMEKTSGTTSLTRFQQCNNTIVVDSVFDLNLTGGTGFRISEQCTDFYLADSIIVGRLHANYADAGGATPDVSGLVAERVTRYTYSDTNPGAWSSSSSGNSGTVNNCQMYSPSFHVGSSMPISPFTGSNPTVLSWDEATVPDPSGYGADH